LGHSLLAAAAAIGIAVVLVFHASPSIAGRPPAGFSPVKGQMQTGRIRYAMAMLPDGEVLIAGGLVTRSNVATVLASAEIYDPLSQTFRATRGLMNVARDGPTATPLPDGTVLIAGGRGNTNILQSVELYVPASDEFVPLTSQMHDARYFHSATALKDGTVLIAGGVNQQAETLNTAEIFNPVTRSFADTGDMTTPRNGHVAVRLDEGSVLIAGGDSSGTDLSSAEIYDPTSKLFHATTHEMHLPRNYAAASIMPGNLVLIAGGQNSTDVLSSAEVYDPKQDGFIAISSAMNAPRFNLFTAALPSGQVLVGGGATTPFGSGTIPTASVDIFDPGSFKFRPTGTPLHIARQTFSSQQQAAVLSDGSVLVVSGLDFQGNNTGLPVPTGEIYDPVLDTFTVTGGMNNPRAGHTATLLGNGKILITGGANGAGVPLASAEIYDPKSTRLTPTAGPMNVPRAGHAAVRLKSGRVLIVGGGSSTTAEIYDPASDTFRLTGGELMTARVAETATLLANGTVLVAGGLDNFGEALNTAEIYNSITDRFSPANSKMIAARAIHAAALLKGGSVLLVGGSTDSNLTHAIASAEIYNAKTGSFTATGSMASERTGPAAIFVSDGTVLVTGGVDSTGTILSTAEVFDPKAGSFSATETPMSTARLFHAMASLKNGRVLVSGGRALVGSRFLSVTSTDIYDPRTRSFSAGPTMTSPRDSHTATLFSMGRVLITGGNFGADTWPTAEVLSP
jgi:N-acetylneuraminic acid mutarotase